MREYHVYMLSNRSRSLYIGVTGNLQQRIGVHRAGKVEFTAKYQIHRLVYVESTNDIRVALQREKQLKGWTRKRKIELIISLNPAWEDLAEGWPALDY
jgi:putative endonuclease